MANIGLKALLIIPIIFIVDYMVMIMVASISYLFGFTSDFSSVGKIVILISLLAFILAFVPDIKATLKRHKLS
jgi:hypothetical protein